jgi:hypothetical protein
MGAMAAAVEVRRWQGRVGNTAAAEVQSLQIFVFLRIVFLHFYDMSHMSLFLGWNTRYVF